MKKLGTILGKDIFIDTDDENIAKKAIDHLENLSIQYQNYWELKTKIEVESFKN